MKLPWDRDYFKICLYVIFTSTIIYALKLFIDAAAYIIVDFNHVASRFWGTLKDIIGLFSPLIIAAVIAYLFDPVVDFFQAKFELLFQKKIKPFLMKHNLYNRLHFSSKEGLKKRTAGAALTYIMFTLIITIIILALINKGSGKGDLSVTESLVKSINGIVTQISDMLVLIRVTLIEWQVADYLERYLNQLILEAKRLLDNIGSGAVNSLSSAGSAVANFFIALVIAFYMMQRKDSILCAIKDLAETFLPKRVNGKFTNLFGDFHIVLSGYIRGQLTDAVIMAGMMSISMWLIGVDFAIVIGVVTGFSNLIPYLGALIGFVLAITMALITGPPVKMLYAAIVVLVIQQIDSIFIVPKVVGEKVKLSPPVVILSLTIAGNLFGLFGMVLVVPICAMGKILITRYIARYKAEKLLSEKKD